MQKLTDLARLSEQLTVANEEIARLRRAARAAPGAASGTWSAAARTLPPADRARIAEAIDAARNVFRWARRRKRLENARWQHRDPGTELRTLARRIRTERQQRKAAA